MNQENDLRSCPPPALRGARHIAHRATQLLTNAARANLDPAPDDSHSNLGWDRDKHCFLSQPLSSGQDPSHIGLSLSPLRLMIVANGGLEAILDLNGITYAEAVDWLDRRLGEQGLKPASALKAPYELPADAAAVKTFEPSPLLRELSALSAWFDLAQTLLVEFTQAQKELHPDAVRCWPHHFDIATYVQLEAGDFENAKGIGVGMSPGDDSYDEPYFYINPWPHLDSNDLPELPAPGHWHREGFVGAIATAEEVLGLDTINTQLAAFLDAAFAVGRDKLGI